MDAWLMVEPVLLHPRNLSYSTLTQKPVLFHAKKLHEKGTDRYINKLTSRLYERIGQGPILWKEVDKKNRDYKTEQWQEDQEKQWQRNTMEGKCDETNDKHWRKNFPKTIFPQQHRHSGRRLKEEDKMGGGKRRIEEIRRKRGGVEYFLFFCYNKKNYW